jgi:hypothetical protein
MILYKNKSKIELECLHMECKKTCMLPIFIYFDCYIYAIMEALLIDT